MIDLPVLETERLWLRGLRSSDATDLHIAFSDPECMRWSHREPTRSIEESAKVVSQIVENDAGQWAFVLHGTETVVGHVGFVTNLTPGGHAGFGYALRRSEWGQGYATEAATVALGYGFDHVGFIYGDPPTVASVIVHPPWAGNASIQIEQSEHAEAGQGEVYVMVGPGIDALAAKVISTGAEVISALADRPWGMREMDLRDPDGNFVRIGSPSDGSRFRSN